MLRSARILIWSLVLGLPIGFVGIGCSQGPATKPKADKSEIGKKPTTAKAGVVEEKFDLPKGGRPQ